MSPIAVNPLSTTPTGSFFLPSFDEAIAMGYVTHSGTVELTPMSGSIAEISGIKPGSIVLEANGVNPKAPEAFIKIVESSSAVDLILASSGSTESYVVTVIPNADHKIGSMVGYHGLALNRSYQLRLSFWDAIQQ